MLWIVKNWKNVKQIINIIQEPIINTTLKDIDF